MHLQLLCSTLNTLCGCRMHIKPVRSCRSARHFLHHIQALTYILTTRQHPWPMCMSTTSNLINRLRSQQPCCLLGQVTARLIHCAAQPPQRPTAAMLSSAQTCLESSLQAANMHLQLLPRPASTPIPTGNNSSKHLPTAQKRNQCILTNRLLHCKIPRSR